MTSSVSAQCATAFDARCEASKPARRWLQRDGAPDCSRRIAALSTFRCKSEAAVGRPAHASSSASAARLQAAKRRSLGFIPTPTGLQMFALRQGRGKDRQSRGEAVGQAGSQARHRKPADGPQSPCLCHRLSVQFRKRALSSLCLFALLGR